jgi:hypothetical protein
LAIVSLASSWRRIPSTTGKIGLLAECHHKSAEESLLALENCSTLPNIYVTYLSVNIKKLACLQQDRPVVIEQRRWTAKHWLGWLCGIPQKVQAAGLKRKQLFALVSLKTNS